MYFRFYKNHAAISLTPWLFQCLINEKCSFKKIYTTNFCIIFWNAAKGVVTLYFLTFVCSTTIWFIKLCFMDVVFLVLKWFACKLLNRIFNSFLSNLSISRVFVVLIGYMRLLHPPPPPHTYFLIILLGLSLFLTLSSSSNLYLS